MKVSIVFICSLFLLSCGNNQEKNTEVKTDKLEHHNEEETTEALGLTEGQKWTVDQNTAMHIKSMEINLENFKGTTVAEYQTLATSLKQNTDDLIKNCTMTGKAHDELHKWLLPHISLVKKFTEVMAF